MDFDLISLCPQTATTVTVNKAKLLSAVMKNLHILNERLPGNMRYDYDQLAAAAFTEVPKKLEDLKPAPQEKPEEISPNDILMNAPVHGHVIVQYNLAHGISGSCRWQEFFHKRKLPCYVSVGCTEDTVSDEPDHFTNSNKIKIETCITIDINRVIFYSKTSILSPHHRPVPTTTHGGCFSTTSWTRERDSWT